MRNTASGNEWVNYKPQHPAKVMELWKNHKNGAVSRRHFTAAIGAFSARLDTGVHIADPLAILRAFLANLCAFCTGMLVVWRPNQHEMRRGPAYLGASTHEPEVIGFGMLASHLKAMVHRHVEARAVAFETGFNTCFHFR